ncbi:hypothetical protein ASPACDRAFT_80253 [Aspergillus aculeatus ATCC 16872]|uniref:Ubiquitin conjugating enzyme n=1 Tax=Aspergillus aculeatus (strain ATCC 16872 / CBS 172.66 / WB 5094) TaxID=690307 RepID=A0A1L9WPL7_ASPA1|nr:uncharacterized protein ASPACDRAFT_80253 [Aspergillus aculeatus ATCC 16872]OJJ98132.1 hypothetical protein ASPACDRAFT_80253 [Aspergillus aculeatus ATCC 16872]
MAISSLLRRGVEAAVDYQSRQPSQSQPTIHLAGWLSAFFIFTVLAFIAILLSVEYTYGQLVPTLAIVEDTNPDIYVRIDTDFDPNKPVDATEPEIETRPQPITNKLCTTIRHLRARAGPWSRFRGLSMYLAYCFAQSAVYSLVPFSASAFLPHYIMYVLSGVLVANLQLAWVHIVISEPSPKRFYQRIGGFKTWKRIAPVAAFEHAVTGAGLYAPLFLIEAFGGFDGLKDLNSFTPTDPSFTKAIWTIYGLLLVPTVVSFVVSIPARAIFLRVAASMLPEEDEAIVPFDRSYGGKVQPAILGGSGKLSISDAWKTLDRAALTRFVKSMCKAVAIEAGVTMFFSLLLTGQILAGAVTYGFPGNNV